MKPRRASFARKPGIGNIEACHLPPQAREENGIASLAHANIQRDSRLEALDNIHQKGRRPIWSDCTMRAIHAVKPESHRLRAL